MTNQSLLRITLLSSLLMLFACSSVNTSPEKTYYVLQNDALTRITEISGTPKVSVRYVKLPEYLNQRGIARLLPNGQINVSYEDLWAEKLSLSLPRLIAENLSQKLRSPVETHPLPPGIHVDSLIEINISQFIGNEKSLQLKASYRLIKPKQLKTYAFSQTIALSNHRTAVLIGAYSKAIDALSVDIAQKLARKP